jgi:anti-sigma factor RsiW
MSCEAVDLKSYILGEASREERPEIRAHIAACASCREEMTRLDLTRSALLSVRDEEIPRRIGFVSDKVFEPRWYDGWRRWVPQMIMPAVTAAALVFAFVAPRMQPAPAAPQFVVRQQTAPAAVPVDVDAKIQAAVAKAVAEVEARQEKRTAELLVAADRKHQIDLRAMQVAFEEDWRLKMKQLGTMYVAMNRMDAGGGK